MCGQENCSFMACLIWLILISQRGLMVEVTSPPVALGSLRLRFHTVGVDGNFFGNQNTCVCVCWLDRLEKGKFNKSYSRNAGKAESVMSWRLMTGWYPNYVLHLQFIKKVMQGINNRLPQNNYAGPHTHFTPLSLHHWTPSPPFPIILPL